ncbi:hypothetical protein [Streptomyces sp. XD-27]|uniref:hypothetical protein n=1 Tax=Streptomyces sp. XD-27 TaxID=3062779 RepID=UPI0026F43C9C|nr:hypothetical protein [Streptomyces sp. XD-27]WKX69785.1 hypothetical protein Q3Y56_07550 [Streptomyces sp. XD-27]
MKGLTWVVWRQYRTLLLTGAALAAALAAYIVYQRFELVGFQRDHGIAGCDRLQPECHGREVLDGFDDEGPNALGKVLMRLESDYREPLLDTGRLLLVLPLLIGTFLGAPLLARELETGTYRLAWAQSVSPRRWLAAKLALPAAFTLLVSAALTALYGWWWHPSYRDFGDLIWTSDVPFLTTGPAAVALALLALLLGATIGLLVRRTLPAMVVSLAATAGVRYVLELPGLRSALWPRQTTTSGELSGFGPVLDAVPGDARDIKYGYVTASGERTADGLCAMEYPDRCLADHGVVKTYAVYHPSSHFWPMQWVQAGICLAAAAALAAFCLWWVGRRPAA